MRVTTSESTELRHLRFGLSPRLALGCYMRSSRTSCCPLQHLRGAQAPLRSAVGAPFYSATCMGTSAPDCPSPAEAARGARPPRSCSPGARAARPPPARSVRPAAPRPGGHPPPQARRPPAACLRSSPARGSCAGCARRGDQHDARSRPMPSRPADTFSPPQAAPLEMQHPPHICDVLHIEAIKYSRRKAGAGVFATK